MHGRSFPIESIVSRASRAALLRAGRAPLFTGRPCSTLYGQAVLHSLWAGRAPLATVLGFRSFELDEDRPPRVSRIGHHFRMRTEARLRVSDAIGPLAVNGLCERAPGTL